jgi:hypothetical protein
MKLFLKILGILAGVIVIVVITGLIYFNSAYPNVDPPVKVKIESTMARIERGKYLANHVTVCMDCHSVRDWSRFSGPIKPGTEGAGGDVFDENVGFPGKIIVKNITPAALGTWSDGEIVRAITCGANKKGDPLFPVMPYMGYNKLGQEDLYSIIAYIRTLHPVKNQIPDKELNFPLNFIVKTMPLKNYKPGRVPDRTNSVEYGKYLVTIASCGDCHTKAIEGKPVAGMEFAGGQSTITPLGTITSANITPHKETGIGAWTKEQFIQRFKSMDPAVNKPVFVKPGEFNTIMPWTLYSGMTEEDLGAIYDYLQSIKPVYNNVTRFIPPKTKIAANFNK